MFVFGASFGSKSQAMEPLTLKKRSIRCLKLGKRKIRENERIRDNEDGNCGWCVYGIENECLGMIICQHVYVSVCVVFLGSLLIWGYG
ncbi:hypothetical protein Lalb_Chr19g0125271 [Lupinus albus]|uniref:Uncharacterized protein n=1 Tax=Lupinus albus TaxID=3870 RepID=A0A6A4NRH4_LUPAL|nr:hypothetical protein Lalb_Chr19g0125271 [Lupinus albus]